MANSGAEETSIMCGICHVEPPINGVQLKCSHIFCYLCIKSASEISCACAICRTEIGDEFNFQEHNLLGTIKVPTPNDGKFWFYEGFQGWWLFDPDTNKELEEAFQQGAGKLEKFIAGGSYIFDLTGDTMTQRRQDDPHARVREIRRATLALDNILGMAGIKGCDFNEVLQDMRMMNTQDPATRVPPVPAPRSRTTLR